MSMSTQLGHQYGPVLYRILHRANCSETRGFILTANPAIKLLANTVVFVRVPKCGSTTFAELMRMASNR